MLFMTTEPSVKRRVDLVTYQLAPFFHVDISSPHLLPAVSIGRVSAYDTRNNTIYLAPSDTEDIGIIAEEAGHYIRHRAYPKVSETHIVEEFIGGVARGLLSGRRAWKSEGERQKANQLLETYDPAIEEGISMVEESPTAEDSQELSYKLLNFELLRANYLGHELAQRVLDTNPLKFLETPDLISKPPEELQDAIFSWLKRYEKQKI